MRIYSGKYLTLAAFMTSALLAACGGGGSTTPPVSTNPQPTPTLTPSAPPTIQPLDYMPFDNGATYYSARPNGWNAQPFPVESLAYSATSSCAKPVPNNTGDFTVTAGSALVYTPPSAPFNPAGIGTYIVTKDNLDNVWIVGTFLGPTSTCVTPYLWMKSQVTVGTSWNYTDVFGISGTATVTAIQPAQSFTMSVGSDAGKTFTYDNVVQVNYGATFTMYWVPGYGPAATTSTVANSQGNTNWLADGFTLSSTPLPTPTPMPQCQLPSGVQAALVYPAPSSIGVNDPNGEVVIGSTASLSGWSVGVNSANVGFGTSLASMSPPFPAPNQLPSFANPVYQGAIEGMALPAGATYTVTISEGGCTGITLGSFST